MRIIQKIIKSIEFKLICLLILIQHNCIAQQINLEYLLSEFQINYGSGYHEIYSSSQLEKQNAFIIFYKTEDSLLYFANCRYAEDSQSFGEVVNFKQKQRAKNKIMKFNWKYINTYDKRTGIAKVKIIEYTDSATKKGMVSVLIRVPNNRIDKEKAYKILLKGSSETKKAVDGVKNYISSFFKHQKSPLENIGGRFFAKNIVFS